MSRNTRIDLQAKVERDNGEVSLPDDNLNVRQAIVLRF